MAACLLHNLASSCSLAPSTWRQFLSPKRPSKRGNGDRIGQGKPSLKYPYHHIENLRKFNRSYQSRCTFSNPSTREKAHHHARTKKKYNNGRSSIVASYKSDTITSATSKIRMVAWLSIAVCKYSSAERR